MSIAVRIVAQSFDGGSNMYGHWTSWRLDKESKDVHKVCRQIDHANREYAREHHHTWYDPGKSEFYMWDQYYTHEEIKDVENGDQHPILAGYSGRTEKQKIDIR